MSPCLTLPSIYCFRLSEASSFRRKKINMRHKLVTSSFSRSSKLVARWMFRRKKNFTRYTFIMLITLTKLSLLSMQNNSSRITSNYRCLHIRLFLDIFQFNKTLIMFSFLFCFSIWRLIEKF